MIERGLIKTSDGYIHYRSDGEGKPLILLHCTLRSSTSFLDVIPLLAKRYRVYALDTPGFGDSDRPSRPYTIPDYARAVTEALTGLGLEKANVLGEAMGALMAMELAGTYPDKVERLILQSLAFFPDSESQRRRLGQVGETYRTTEEGFPMPRTFKEAMEWDTVRRPRNPTEVWLDRENTDLGKAGKWFLKGYEAVARYDINSALERIQCPTLLVTGEYFLYRQFQDELTRRIRDVQVAIIPGAQLMPQVDNPEEVSRVLTNFIGGP
ncbi:alpha/beta fold hydrolase [Chloroflexota bacterium]